MNDETNQTVMLLLMTVHSVCECLLEKGSVHGPMEESFKVLLSSLLVESMWKMVDFSIPISL